MLREDVTNEVRGPAGRLTLLTGAAVGEAGPRRTAPATESGNGPRPSAGMVRSPPRTPNARDEPAEHYFAITRGTVHSTSPTLAPARYDARSKTKTRSPRPSPQSSPHLLTDTRGPRQPSSRLIRTHGAGCRLVVPWFHDYGVRRRRMDNPYESIERHPSVSH